MRSYHLLGSRLSPPGAAGEASLAPKPCSSLRGALVARKKETGSGAASAPSPGNICCCGRPGVGARRPADVWCLLVGIPFFLARCARGSARTFVTSCQPRVRIGLPGEDGRFLGFLVTLFHRQEKAQPRRWEPLPKETTRGLAGPRGDGCTTTPPGQDQAGVSVRAFGS